MANCRHHSGYLADDEAGHSTYVTRVQPPKKSVFLDMGPTSKLGREPHPPSTYASPALRCHRQKRTSPQPFGSFLDFLTEGQVLESLQTVVEEAAERMAAMKTEAGLPLVEVQDPMEMPSVRHRVHARPSLKTVHRHRAQPSLCMGRPNNYPSCSSSMSDSQSSLMAGCLGSHSRDSDLGAHGLGSLPPMRDKLLLEKNLKRLLRLENKGKGLSQSCSRRDSLLWDSLDSQTSSLGNREQPLSWFSGLLGSSSDIPEASDLGPGEQELIFLQREFNKELKSRLSQLSSFNLPGYCSLREPHHTLDFLAKHQLFPALQSVVSQAVDKLSGAYRRDGCPLFPANFQATSELPSDFIEPPLTGRRSSPNSKLAETTTDREEPCNSLHTTGSSPKMTSKKSKGKQGTPSILSAPVATRFRLKETPTEESNFPKKKPVPSISPRSTTSRHCSPWYEELMNFLTQQAVSLLICKYKFENRLNKQLGLISFPIAETLMDLALGFKKVKGSHIRLSSKVDWTCLLRKLEEADKARNASRISDRRSTESVSSRSPSARFSSTRFSSTKPPSTQVSSTKPPSTQASSTKPPSTQASSTKPPSTQASSTKPPSTQASSTKPPSTQASSTKPPSVQPELATDKDQPQAVESHHSFHADLLASQPLSSQEPVTAEDQTLMSLSEPKLSVSSGIGVGSSAPKSQETVNIKDSDDRIEIEDEDEDKDEDEFEDEFEDEDEDEASFKDESMSQSEESLVRHSVDMGQSDPP
ncbi:coiled-coil domain-containing protein 116 [Nycticebus coucang]|uniref:coiled-coil domain-containing protein 116 n=1 Tax=Nycticebus coucang TaxID=9470 RepID=UPI00234DE5A1|nr:coiled-coil domain-containing protein 116 [Nycticebus coucang]